MIKMPGDEYEGHYPKFPTDRLAQSASLARGDLARYLENADRKTHWRAFQTIRMITEDLGDQKTFELIWERWRAESNSTMNNYMPSFKDLMDKEHGLEYS